MGIVDEILADIETSEGRNYRVEWNEDGSIHLHTEHIRIDMDTEEFVAFAEAIVESKEILLEMKDDIGEPVHSKAGGAGDSHL